MSSTEKNKTEQLYTCTDRTPYTYLIGWTATQKFYYGVRYSKGCTPDDLFVKYFTSSNLVKEMVISHGNPDVIQVRRIFNDKDSAISWENKVLRRIKSSQHPKMLNCHNGQYITPFASQEFKNMLNTKYGVEYTSQIESVKCKVSQKLSGRRAMYNITTNQMVYIDKATLDLSPQDYLHPSSYAYRNLIGDYSKQVKTSNPNNKGKVVVYDKELKILVKIPSSEYRSLANVRYLNQASAEYKQIIGGSTKHEGQFKSGVCTVIDTVTNEIIRVDVALYQENPNNRYVHINSKLGKQLKLIIDTSHKLLS
jgi:hypothetical protein